MNKQKFVQLLSNQESFETGDLGKIKELENEYPYSQVLHILSAIGSYKSGTSDSKSKLALAAVYATDRSVLKEAILSATKPVEVEKDEEVEFIEEEKEKVILKSDLPKTEETPVSGKEKDIIIDKTSRHPGHLSNKDAEKLRKDVMKNLEKLMSIKSHFLDGTLNDLTPKTAKSEENIKSKKAKTQKKKKLKDQKELLKKKSKNSKSEQNKIIEKFINEKPTIAKGRSSTKDEDENKDDLSTPSVEFGDQLVSENLAKILAKQGKTEKAIDIYKKLVWKFPQKKAYFASQIESLKEK